MTTTSTAASTSTSTATARPATGRDADALVALRAVLLDSMQLDADDPGWHDGYRARLGDPDVFAAVAEDDGEVVASAVALLQRRLPTPGTPSGTYGWLEQVATRPDARGQGHARACVLACLDWLREQGVHEVQMQSTEAGEPLYRELGFTDDPQARLVLRLV